MKAARETLTIPVEIPRSALTLVAAPPDLLSQRNAEATCGVPARAYLDLLRAPDCPLRVSRIGKLRIVDRADFVAWIKSRGVATAAPIALSPTEPIDPVDALAASLGLVPTGKGRGRP